MSLSSVKTVDLTPSPQGMRETLRFIVHNSLSEEHREWASSELHRIKDVTEWLKEPSCKE